MTEGKKKWWLIPAVLLLVIALLAGIFWKDLAVYLAPKATLTAALRSTWSDLEQRFSGSPLMILADGFDASMQNSIVLDLDTRNELLGDMHWHMDIRTDGTSGNTLAEGTVSTEKNTLDLSVYVGREFAAVSSQSLLQGGFYGITYDTFSEDIRSNQLLTFMLGKDTVSQWEESVAELKETMNRSFSAPEFSQADISTAMMGLLTTKAQVEKNAVTVNGENQAYYSISFRVEGAQLLAAAQYAQMELPVAVDETSVLTSRFDLCDGKVMQILLELTGPEYCRLHLDLGQNPAADDLRLRLVLGQGTDRKEYEGAILRTEKTDTLYSESLYFARTEHNRQEGETISYVYTPATGGVSLQRDDRIAELTLTDTEEGFRIESHAIERVLEIFSDEVMQGSSHGVLAVSKGEPVTAPEYKNLDELSSEDLLTLLGGIGSLLGMNFAG